jgi:anti-sigma factor ChrR (cupin superfamily)
MADTIGRQTTGSYFVDPARLEWHQTDAPGFLVKPIFMDKVTGESTLLMKIEAGACFPAHSHEHLEEIFVLEGEFYDEERTYGAGCYCQRAAGASHTAGSKSGCTVLLIYRS